MRALTGFLVVFADAGFASGVAKFLAAANIPHTPEELGSAAGACLFWLIMQYWHHRSTVRAVSKEYDRRAALSSPPTDEQAPPATELGN
jgi:hypothetical protein